MWPWQRRRREVEAQAAAVNSSIDEVAGRIHESNDAVSESKDQLIRTLRYLEWERRQS